MKRSFLIAVFLVLGIVSLSKNAAAGPPLTNLEGVGGIAFNPLAYLADSDGEEGRLKAGETDVAGLPRFGIWYVDLDDVNIDWTAIGVAETFFKRVEVSYGYETVDQDNATPKRKNNVGVKFLLLPENAFDNKFLPAVSVGTVLKSTSNLGAGADNNGEDYYIVATKLLDKLPRPVLLSAGGVSTNSKTTGVLGYDKDRKITGFANIDIILPKNLIAGFEYKQGARYGDWKDANYWETHVAWTPNKELTLVLAYVNAGDQK